MPEKKNVFISHVHEDDDLVPKLKDLIVNAGMEVSNYSITSDKPNEAHNEEYIKREILAPQIERSSTLVVLITHTTSEHPDYVNWEIKYAVEHNKRVVGVFAHGCTDADIPEELDQCADAAIVGWQGDRVVRAINGDISEWDDPQTGMPRNPHWPIRRHSCI